MVKRILTALVLAPVVLAACVVENPLFLFSICLLFATLAFWELRVLLDQPKALPVVTLFGLAVPFFGTQVQANRDPVQVMLYASLFWGIGLIFLITMIYRGKSNSAGTDMAGLWISMPFTCLLMLHKLQPSHPTFPTQDCFLLLILIPVWAGDIAGLLIGKKFGRHQLIPSLSPKKSWEGSIANLLACIAVSVALVPVIGDRSRILLHVLVGLTIGITGQLGDLLESWLKRSKGVKDSGSILPGHGGVLDRIDSLILAAPLVCLELIVAFH